MRTIKGYRGIALVLCLAVITQIFLASISGSIGNNRETAVSDDTIDHSRDDRRIASELAGLTGIHSEEILQLKAQYGDWNTVTTELRKQSGVQGGAAAADLAAIAGEGLIEALRSNGYSEERISGAVLLAERVELQISELLQLLTIDVQAAIAIADVNQDDEQETLRIISDHFEPDVAVYWTLKLEDAMGGSRPALNEYLACLQLGCDIELLLDDQEAYEQAKRSKMSARGQAQLITIEWIEQKLVELLSSQTREPNKVESGKSNSPSPTVPEQVRAQAPKPVIDPPTAESVKPSNPTSAILEEMKVLNPKEAHR